MKKINSTTRQTYSAPEIAEYLGISRTGAYNLMQAEDFPSIRIGNRVMVTIAAFDAWLEQRQSMPK